MFGSAAYRRLCLATAISNVGDGVTGAALPLLAVTITHDPRLVSLVSAAAFLPWLLVSLPVGALVDRHDRVAIMWRAQVLQATAVLAIAFLAAFGRAGIVDLGLLAFVLGLGEVAFGNAAQSSLPQFVPRDRLHAANGTQNAISTAGRLFVGPPLGSLLFGIAVGLPFGLDAASFAMSAALLATLPRARRAPQLHPPVRRAVAEGVRWLAGHRLLRTLAVLLGINTFCNQFGNATLVLLATDELHVSPRGYGLLLTGTAVGAVVGGLVNARIVARVGETRVLLASMAGMSLAYLGTGLAPDAAVLGGFMALTGFVVTLWNVVTVTLRQDLVPVGLLGRVNSVYRMVGWGFMPWARSRAGWWHTRSACARRS